MMQPGYVYIVYGEGTRYIKIGKTTRLVRRVRDLSHGVPFPVHLLYAEFVHDMDDAEKMLLEGYAAFRSRGEWFELSPDALASWPTEAFPFASIPEASQPRPPRVRLTLTQRILRLLDREGALTARRLQQYIGRVSTMEIRGVLTTLLHDATITASLRGKRLEYLRPLPVTDDGEPVPIPEVIHETLFARAPVS